MNRIECLNELLEFKVSLSTLSKNLSEFDWDYDEEPTLIKVHHILKVLQSYLDEKLSASDLEGWANLIEGREDLDFDPKHAEELEDIFHSLANPVLEGKISKIKCTDYINRIRDL
jgi:hypothetical protein